MSRKQIYIVVGGGCLLAFCAVAALVVGVLFIVPTYTSHFSSVSDVVSVNTEPHPNADKNSMGDPNAPIQIVEFGDFQCPFCKHFHTDTEALLIKNYVETGKVFFTYRSAGNWVSNNAGGSNTESQDAALAAYCAADQNKFWDMHDALFANNRDVENQGAFSSQRLSAIAKSIGLDMKAFQDCYDNGNYTYQVQQDHDDAIAVGVQGTPSFVVTFELSGVASSYLIQGAQPYTTFQQMLDKTLNTIGQ